MTAARKRRGGALVRVLRRLFLGGCVLWLAALGCERVLDHWHPFPLELLQRHGRSTVVRAADGRVLRVTSTAAEERVLPIHLGDLPPHLIDALLVAEDERFFEHTGVDWIAVARAALADLSRGRVVSGASTLTMQVARLAEPRPRNLAGKLQEMFRARQLERLLDKRSILEHYADMVPLGGVLRGFEAGARAWFGHGARALTTAEAATLVAMIPAPSARAPDRHPARLLRYRNEVLDAMHAAGKLDTAAWARARSQPLGARRHGWPFLAPTACDHLLATCGGGELRSDLDLDLQQRIEQLVARDDPGLADGAAVVVLELPDRRLRALVGSPDYQRSQLDAATCHRPAGSTLKPFLYALALERGIVGEDGLVSDRPGRFGDYRPANFTTDYAGAMRMADALATSRNLPAVRVLHALGTRPFADLLFSLGFATDPRGLQLDAALGTLSVSPLELAHAYARLVTEPEAHGLRRQAVTPILRALSSRALVPGAPVRGDLAWKTGTSSGRRDAWCVGVTEHWVAVVWRGNLRGYGASDLVGVESAGSLLGEVLELLD